MQYIRLKRSLGKSDHAVKAELSKRFSLAKPTQISCFVSDAVRIFQILQFALNYAG